MAPGYGRAGTDTTDAGVAAGALAGLAIITGGGVLAEDAAELCFTAIRRA